MPEEKNTKFCSNCGAEIDIKAKICPKCGVEQPLVPGKVSNWWYLCPLFLGIIGGLVAWVVNKDINPKKAKKLLIIGILIPIVWIIAYFGIMAPIVLVSMGGAREKARDVGIKAELSGMRVTAEIYFWNNEDNYDGFCESSDAEAAIASTAERGGVTVLCDDTAITWAAFAPLKDKIAQCFCVDSRGTAKNLNRPCPKTAVTICP